MSSEAKKTKTRRARREKKHNDARHKKIMKRLVNDRASDKVVVVA